MEFCINDLGNNGHLGNQMFQYAFIKTLAKKYNANFCIPPNEVFGRFYYQKLFSNIDDCFDIKCDRRMEQYPSIRERFFHYDQELINNYVKNLEVNQTFQNFSNQAIADKLGFAEYYFMDYKKYNQALETYKTIKAEQLTDICKKYFNPENLKVINIKPAME